MEQGEEKMNDFITAEHIFDVLQQHHKILKDLKPQHMTLDDKVYDNIIILSSDADDPIDSKIKLVRPSKIN